MESCCFLSVTWLSLTSLSPQCVPVIYRHLTLHMPLIPSVVTHYTVRSSPLSPSPLFCFFTLPAWCVAVMLFGLFALSVTVCLSLISALSPKMMAGTLRCRGENLPAAPGGFSEMDALNPQRVHYGTTFESKKGQGTRTRLTC